MKSIRFYIEITVALIGLLLLTVGVAYLDLGPFNVSIALLISIVKALLIIIFFMHVSHASAPVLLYVLGGFFWLGIMLVLTLGDYFSRYWR